MKTWFIKYSDMEKDELKESVSGSEQKNLSWSRGRDEWATPYGAYQLIRGYYNL